MPSLGAAAEAEAFQEAPHAGVAVVGLGEHAMQVMVVDEGRDDRAEGLGRQARALAAGRERDVHLGGPRLVGKDVNGAVADQPPLVRSSAATCTHAPGVPNATSACAASSASALVMLYVGSHDWYRDVGI